MEKATFGAGCFWHVEEVFRQAQGVVSTQAGYMGGAKENPTYEDVCSRTTGHAEVVEVTFDPSRVSYDELLQLFWNCHDPTQLNRQGPDVGSNYRSVIFCHSAEQAERARASLKREESPADIIAPLSPRLSRPASSGAPRSTISSMLQGGVSQVAACRRVVGE